MAKLVVYTNCLIYVWALYAFMHGALDVYASPFWTYEMSAMRGWYLVLLAFAALYTLVAIAGLLAQRRWSRTLAFWWDIALALIVGGLPLLSDLMLARMYRFGPLMELISRDTLLGLAAAAVLLALAFGLHRPPVKALFG